MRMIRYRLAAAGHALANAPAAQVCPPLGPVHALFCVLFRAAASLRRPPAALPLLLPPATLLPDAWTVLGGGGA